MAKKYEVQLSEEEQEQIKQMLSNGKAGVRQVKRAQILLAAEKGLKDEHVCLQRHSDVGVLGM